VTRLSVAQLFTGFCLCLCAWTAAPSHAEAKQNEYQELIKQALHEYRLGNFSEAKVFFSHAHALSPNARTLRGLGMSSYELRNYVEAIDYFEQALDSKKRPLTRPMRKNVTKLLSQSRSFVTQLQLHVEPEQAEAHIDTRPVTRDKDGNILLNPGTHELSVEFPDYEPIAHTIRTNGGESLTMNISLQRSKPGAAAAATAAPLAAAEGERVTAASSELAANPDATKPEPDATKPELETWSPESSTPTTEGVLADTGTPLLPKSEKTGPGIAPWLLIGGGGAVAIAGGVALVLALSYKSDVENPSGNSPRYEDYKSKQDLVGPLSTVGIIGIGAGLAAVTGGVIWKLRSNKPDHETTSLRLNPTGMQLHVQF
jgi:hypothetical protein